MSNQKKWFFLKNNEVSGPYAVSEIDPLAALHPEGLVWGQGLNEWVSHAEWKSTIQHLDSIIKGLQNDMTPTWVVKFEDTPQGPMTYDQLVQTLKAHPHPSETQIKQVTDSDWKGIYEYPTLVEEVGITRRQHSRAPISGIFKYTKNGATHEALMASISEGGIGILEAEGIAVGDTLKGEIQSPQLATAINCQCDVLYQQSDGNWGLRFVNLPAEYSSVIVEYALRFQPSKE